MKKAILPAEITLALQASQLLLGWLLLISTLAVVCVLWSLSLVMALPLCALSVAWANWQVRKHALLSLPSSWRGLRVDVYGRMFVQDNRQQWHAVEILPESVVHPYLMILHFKPSEGDGLKHHFFKRVLIRISGANVMVILLDQASAESRRQLRVWLRWGLSFKSGDAQSL